ncbi:phytoene/squalene synthase family protein [Solirubrobacter ginsenosidimutans]|uniref:Phytoene/squalene synthase family protein n=1 Tax=Solirubrobacter ginsenosidimutans TaxID=490573 RepID=A0A9X3S5J0_9ACTN|nr:phytoene/squalene synthase family protein [Solirubrobacter ginsenosidimutans]MDA0165692.1 phytoene/squalene synthase family protein [Solirubrobacter ginsenosidimutans]
MTGAAAAPRADLREARATTRRVAGTFALACRLLPRAVRDDVYLLYLVLRTLDDLVDDGHMEASARVDAVAAWAAGQVGPGTREVAILDALAARHPLPRRAVADFCTGMHQDLARATFAGEADVDRYCYRVAGTVGLLMTAVLGARDERRAGPAAVALGMAMQRTNILRDIDEDLARGRIYVSQEALERHGSLLPGRRSALLREQIAYADRLYEVGLAGVDALGRGRRAIAAAGAAYREILRQLERDGYGVSAGRSSVPTPRKLAVAGRAACRG